MGNKVSLFNKIVYYNKYTIIRLFYNKAERL